MSGRITAIDANLSYNNEVIVGTASGGAWLSTDGGLTWKTIFDDTDCQAVGSIKINPKNPDEIWIGTGEGNPRNSQNSGKGIYRSIDGAKTWKKMGLENTKVIHRILINHQNDKIVYAAALGSAWGPNSERGVFRSKDGGTTWEKSLYVNDSTGCAELVMDPKNPNKLIAAMWQYERKPWTFTSGGKGSGIYITYDGGDSWKKIGEKNGLPAGDLGRIGLAIAPSNPLIVYAIVEAEKNAFYISEDGGENWRKTGENNIGNRPFYYHEIYVDPKEEKSIYSIHTTITKSYDGGKNFENFVDWNIHPDHHAFWIDPNDPNHIINGNDGGLNITYDMGKSWKYVENIPVGQFYHVNYDYEIPFNVYGGLQDNGSWVGPSSVWADGSIQNFHWKELLFGDGFDVMPDASDSRYGYAMSQGGSLNYYDKITGTTRFIRPIHPQNVILRCNWNAAIAQSPFKKECVYFGSQFLHKSCDKGHSWEIISPDLSTNDTLKQQQAKSGGLTPDATAAENHCTILCIAPSNHNEDIIWVGTDDGNLQLTTDGGKTWVNQNNKLPNFPKNGWIPQIEVSKVDANEVFVVVNDYRQNNWEPYLYHTSNNGKSWSRIVGSKDVEGHCLSIVQDSIASNLLFLGTDFGLYFSIDKGKHWQKFTKKFPSVSVTDIKIHPQTSDLILATFGRGIWIVDNINPLRELALSSFTPNKTVFKFFQPTDAYIAFYASNSGPHFPGDAIYSAPNKP
ncbi:MAG: hypothetical protein KA010_03845, partial [Saprospiraceae bacterium]|nr:hypothetical protein [Saprospiraceae bacterium]